MTKIFFIINPVSGGGRTKKLIPDITKIMEKTNIDYEIGITQKPKDGIRISRDAIERGYDSLIAVGGDGTVNEVAISILELGRGTLGILPTGTGNDLARSLDLPLNMDKAMELIIRGNKKELDVSYVNDKLCLNIGSIGFDAEVVRNTRRIKKRIKSSIAYTISVIYTFFNFKKKNITIEIDDEVINEDIFLVAIGSGKYYGGGIKILPMSIIDDGYLYVCVVREVSKFKFLYAFPSIAKGNHEKFKDDDDIQIFKAKKIKVTTQDKTYLNIDGELYDVDKETLFTIDGRKIPIFAEII